MNPFFSLFLDKELLLKYPIRHRRNYKWLAKRKQSNALVSFLLLSVTGLGDLRQITSSPKVPFPEENYFYLPENDHDAHDTFALVRHYYGYYQHWKIIALIIFLSAH